MQQVSPEPTPLCAPEPRRRPLPEPRAQTNDDTMDTRAPADDNSGSRSRARRRNPPETGRRPP
eukprot:5680687-Lingulodinium_polyedra.AAC.1